jgi:hypothetical protein
VGSPSHPTDLDLPIASDERGIERLEHAAAKRTCWMRGQAISLGYAFRHASTRIDDDLDSLEPRRCSVAFEFVALTDLGVVNITLALDNDGAGRAATARAIEASTSEARSPRIWVIDPDRRDRAKDPGDLIRAKGRDGWARASDAPVCCITVQALELTGPLANLDHEPGRRAGLARAR